MTAKTDEQLLAEFVAGRRPALGELADRYERHLLGLAAGLLGGRQDLACDAVQESWIRVIRFARQFRGRSRFKTWLYRVVINQCRNLQAVTVRALGVDGPIPPATAATTAGPDDNAAANDRNHVLRRAVARLNPDQQVIVLLCYHSGMTHEQAAEILEIPLGTLKSRLHAALEELRTSLSASTEQHNAEVRP